MDFFIYIVLPLKYPSLMCLNHSSFRRLQEILDSLSCILSYDNELFLDSLFLLIPNQTVILEVTSYNPG